MCTPALKVHIFLIFFPRRFRPTTIPSLLAFPCIPQISRWRRHHLLESRTAWCSSACVCIMASSTPHWCALCERKRNASGKKLQYRRMAVACPWELLMIYLIQAIDARNVGGWYVLPLREDLNFVRSEDSRWWEWVINDTTCRMHANYWWLCYLSSFANSPSTRLSLLYSCYVWNASSQYLTRE